MLTDDQVKANIAANVTRLLAKEGWSKSELARRTGDTAMAISRICRAEHVAGSGILARIAEAFDVNVDRLILDPPHGTAQKIAG